MIKTTPHTTLSEEAEKRDTIHCVVWASVVVLGMLALMLHGIAFLSWTQPTNEDIYARRRMQNQIEDLYQWRTAMVVEYANDKIKYENHTHVYSTGKPATAK